MKILLQTRFAPAVGGIETLARILVEHWTAQGHRVTVSTDVPADPAKTPYCGPAVVYHRPAPFMLFRLWREADVVVHMMVGMKSVWPMWLRRTPSVFAHHSTYGIHCDGTRDWKERLKLLIASRNPWNICASSFIRDVTFLPKSQVVLNCYDDAIFHQGGPEPRDRDLIFVGRLVSDKGADMVLDAIARSDGGNKWKVTIVGGGPEDERLRTKSADLGLANIRFTGSLPPADVGMELRRHRVMVVPSLWREPFGIVALEGMACGAVPVVADGGGLPEAIGGAGVVFRRGDVVDLAEKLGQLLASDSRQRELRAMAKEHLGRFSVGRMCDAYLEMAKSAFEGGTCRR